ncbi:MAG: cobalamin B12-binding domain-containing protein [Bacteroidales bacterium]|nr:cobalamin B12-binding domain-containing protein [Bacteroidales bacterium]MBN2634185.1 cobalamin B12-binding domain-containing protein [Bacteroidales bacterium]
MKTILGAAIGSCVHVGGLHHFLKLAESEGYITESLGPAVAVARLLKGIEEKDPDIVALSYRLTPSAASELFTDIAKALQSEGLKRPRLIFGGTPPVAEEARKSGLFEKIFDGTESVVAIKQYLRGGYENKDHHLYASTLEDRIVQKYPYPLLRHHFGRPSLNETVEGAAKIAMSGVLDILSIGPDQNAQEHFFRPAEMDHSQDGAGGVPLRKPEDLEAIYESTRCGNYPLVRCYSGTRDLMKWAEMSVRTIKNAWGAIPLCWYSVIDGRSARTLEDAIKENQEVMHWYAIQGIPVEVNESHQWSLRDAHDSLAVTMAFLAAYNAKKQGVRNYVSQYMFNNPPGTSPEMDIAKMLAKNELIEELSDNEFSVFRQVRAGLAHFSSVPAVAKGQLAASAVVSMALKPHILHVVGFSEGDHAIYPDELIESCNIIHGVFHNTLQGMPDLTESKKVRSRKEELKEEAKVLLYELNRRGTGRSEVPWSDPVTIAEAIRTGLLDTPHFQGNPHLRGDILTRLIDGAWYAVDRITGEKMTENERVNALKNMW